jgi:hypothetical protein
MAGNNISPSLPRQNTNKNLPVLDNTHPTKKINLSYKLISYLLSFPK